MDITIALFLMFISTILIAKACDGFEVAADYLGRNMSEGVKGASINAVGSSMPELFATSIFLFVFADTSGFAGGIGTTAGSAVFNTMIIPALSILAAIKLFKVAHINVSKKVVLRDGLMLIAAEFILIVTIGETLEWWHGLMLMLLYLGYSGYMFISMEKKPETLDQDVYEAHKEEEHNTAEGHLSLSNRFIAFFKINLEEAVIANNKITTGNSWTLLLVATTIIAVACYILVAACESFAHEIGIHGYFVAVILVAAASSIPDTILSIKDAKKGNYDDAVSNALGSNIFDICFALGLPLFIYTLIYGTITMPAEMVEHVSELRILLLILTIGAFFVFFFGRSMGQKKAYALLAMYIVFITYIIARAYEMPWIEPVSNMLHTIQGFL
ncbi:MAG: sodium:calcium antiporter [Gammaproteobacteria bacterium]|nr:sodium:calcium antiporter [Gammaproteobacteria bacterium]